MAWFPHLRHRLVIGLLLVALCSTAAKPAQAQSVAECRSPQPSSVGAAIGRSSPYIELWRHLVGVPPGTSLLVEGGLGLHGAFLAEEVVAVIPAIAKAARVDLDIERV